METRGARTAGACLFLVGQWTALAGSAPAQDCRLQIGDPELFRIAQLPDDQRQLALWAVLADKKNGSHEAVFYYGDRLRPTLRSLLRDARAGETAALLLAFIAVPEDVRAVIASPPQPRNNAFANRWAYFVAASLLEPSSDEEWAFLRKCALNEFDDLWAEAGAVQTLKLLAAPRSRAILEEARKRSSDLPHRVTRALEYIDSAPETLSGPNLQALAERIAQAVRIGEWKGNTEARCDEAGDKALVDFTFETPSDRFICTATFHRSDRIWKLRGVRETMQMMIGRPVLTIVPSPAIR